MRSLRSPFRHLTLATKLVSVSLSLAVIVIGATIAIGSTRSRAEQRLDLRQYSNALLRTVGPLTVTEVGTRNVAALDALSATLEERTPNARYWFYDADLVPLRTPPDQGAAEALAPVVAQRVLNGEPAEEWIDGSLLAGMPVLSDGTPVGAIVIRVSGLRSLSGTIAWTTAVAIAGVSIVAVIALVLISRTFTKPLQHLSAELRRLATGDLVTPVSTRGEGEIEHIVASAERMRARLRELYAEMDQQVQRRTAELAESEARSRYVVDHSPHGIAITDADLNVVYANESLLQIAGQPESEVLGASALDLFGLSQAISDSLLTTPRTAPFEARTEALRPGGERRILEVTVLTMTPCSATGQFIIHIVDLTEMIETEQRLRESEARYRELFDHANDIIFSTDAELRFTTVNQVAETLTGYSRQEIVGRPLHSLLSAESQLIAQRAMKDHIAGQDLVVSRFDIITRDGRVLPTEVSTRVARKNGLPSSLHGIARDISERLRAERRIESIARFPSENQNPVLRLGIDGVIRYANEASSSLLQTWDTAIGQAAPEPWALRISDTYEQGRPSQWEERCGDRTIALTLVPVAEQFYVNIYGLDVTAQKHLEEQLRQSVKMEALGRLAGGVAHDFNNLLTVINGYADMALMAVSPDHMVAESLHEIRRAGQSAAELSGRLRAFSRRAPVRTEPLLLNTLIDAMQDMLCRLLGETIDLRFRQAEDLGAINADPSQIEQVIVNLVVNARDAMPHGGTVSISTSSIMADRLFADSHVGMEPGPHVCLTVADTGEGMTPEAKAHLFEPFFTTKPEGKGTGLGLSTVYSTVTQSDGCITVYSEMGHGTEFRIYFPRVSAEGGPVATHQTEEMEPLESGQERILVVEDEDGVRKLTVSALRSLGYSVIEAADAATAEELFAKDPSAIDLVLTDVIMPGRDGPDLAQRLLEARADLRVVFMSGYTDDAIGRHGMMDPNTFLIQKPFRVADLARQIRAALDTYS